MTWTQIIGETRLYRQAITEDVIASVVWTVTPAGAGTVTPGEQTAQYAEAAFLASVSGRCVLQATITTEGGQTVKGRTEVLITS